MNQMMEEQQHLTFVYQKLLAQKEALTHLIASQTSAQLQDLRQVGSDIRLNFDSITDSLDTYAAIESKNREIDQMKLLLASAQNELNKINRLLKRPFFGKLSLRFVDETEEDAFYIGVTGFSDEKKESLIYDWRSQIAAVFYENHQGLTAYQVNGETIAVHRAKGLEYQHVLLYNVNNANYQSELEQRVLYTAISRATETLTITSKEALSDLVMFAKKPQRLLRFFE